MTNRQPRVVSNSSRVPRSYGRLGLGHHVRRARHVLHPAGDEDIAVADGDRCAAVLIAWRPEPHSRLTVRPATSTGRPASSARHPRDVPVVLAGLIGTAEDDVLDERGVDADPLDEGGEHRRREIVRPDGRERAAIAPDRGPDGLDDPCVAERSMEVSGHGRMVAPAGPKASRRCPDAA